MSYPYAKVTITFETVDGETTTYEIPKARNIEINEWAEPVDTEIHKPWAYLTNTLNMGITLKADFDEATQRICLMTKTTVGKEVKPVASFEPDEDSVREMHMIGIHPGYDYKTTEGPRKCWDDVETPPEGEGWERNLDMGRNGWERFDYTEESYWRRKRS